MSRESSYKVKIKRIEKIEGSASMVILKRSVDKVIEQFNGRKVEKIVMDDKKEECLFAMKFNNFPSGIGIDVNEKGEIKIKYETMVSGQEFPKRIVSALKQNYNRFAVEKALRKMGYDSITKEKDKIITIESKERTMPSINTDINESLEMNVDFFGFQGNECLDREIEFIENLLEYGIVTEVVESESRNKSEEEMNLERGSFHAEIPDSPDDEGVHEKKVKIKL